MRRRSWYSLSALALAAVLVTACGSESENGQPAKLKVGTVDIMRVMENRPETVKIRLDWASQAGNTYMEISKVRDGAEARAVQEEIAKRSVEWQKRMDAFMEESVALVEKETAILAKERGLDLVVVDNPLTNSIRYREGEDLTLDVQIQLQNRE